MSVKCAVCGKFIGHNDDWIADYEPLSEFGPERIEHLHRACNSQTFPTKEARAAQKATGVNNGD